MARYVLAYTTLLYILDRLCESTLTGIFSTGLAPYLFSSAMHLLVHIGWLRPPGEYCLRQRRARICCRGISCMSSSSSHALSTDMLTPWFPLVAVKLTFSPWPRPNWRWAVRSKSKEKRGKKGKKIEGRVDADRTSKLGYTAGIANPSHQSRYYHVYMSVTFEIWGNKANQALASSGRLVFYEPT